MRTLEAVLSARWRPDSRHSQPSGEVKALRRASWRLGLQVGLCVAAILVVLSGLAVVVVLRSQANDAAALLHQAVARADDVGDPPAGAWLAIQDQHGLSVTPGTPAGLPDRVPLRRLTRLGATETDDVALRSGTYRVYTLRRATETVQAAMSLRADSREKRDLLTAMLTSGSLGLVLAAGAGVWLGRRAVRPMAGALALQRRFVADAGHELRTPLTLLSTRAQMVRRHLTRGVDRQRLGEEMDGVVSDARHLTDILEDLLLAADTRDALDQTVDLVVLAAQVVAACAPTAADLGVAIATRPLDASVPVRGSNASLRRALTALVDNALRHAVDAVSVTVHQRGRDAHVEVIDDGPGIDPTLLPRVFERFASSGEPRSAPLPEHDDTATAHQRRHYGIGLALVSEVVARHGGSVSAENRPGGGATLRLVLPAGRRPEVPLTR